MSSYFNHVFAIFSPSRAKLVWIAWIPGRRASLPSVFVVYSLGSRQNGRKPRWIYRTRRLHFIVDILAALRRRSEKLRKTKRNMDNESLNNERRALCWNKRRFRQERGNSALTFSRIIWTSRETYWNHNKLHIRPENNEFAVQNGLLHLQQTWNK